MTKNRIHRCLNVVELRPDDEGEQNAAHQSADAEITQGADDEEIGQGEKQQARQTTLRRPEIPEMKFGSVHMPAGYFKK